MKAAFGSFAVIAFCLALTAGCDKTDSTTGPAATAGAKGVGVNIGPQKDKGKVPTLPPVDPPKRP